MIRFERSRLKDDPVYIDEAKISALCRKHDDTAKIFLDGDGEPFTVMHSLEEVVDSLREAGIIIRECRKEKAWD